MSLGDQAGRHHSQIKGRRVGAIQKGAYYHERFGRGVANNSDAFNWRGSRGISWATQGGTPQYAVGYAYDNTAAGYRIQYALDLMQGAWEMDFQFMDNSGAAGSKVVYLLIGDAGFNNGFYVRVDGGGADTTANVLQLYRWGGSGNAAVVDSTWAYDRLRHVVRIERPTATGGQLWLDNVQIGATVTLDGAPSPALHYLNPQGEAGGGEVRIYGLRFKRRLA